MGLRGWDTMFLVNQARFHLFQVWVVDAASWAVVTALGISLT